MWQHVTDLTVSMCLPSSPSPVVEFSHSPHYPGADGEFGRTDPSRIAPDNPLGLDRAPHADDVTTMNEIGLPVGRPVIVQLSSKDVTHSFGVRVMPEAEFREW